MQSIETQQRSRHLRRYLPHHPERALELLHSIPCGDERRRLAAVIANTWSKQDINIAWNSVTRSDLAQADKQVMYNELWG